LAALTVDLWVGSRDVLKVAQRAGQLDVLRVVGSETQRAVSRELDLVGLMVDL
jgi:hypothetical protein